MGKFFVFDNLGRSRHPGESRGPGDYNLIKTLDSGFRRNDAIRVSATFYDSVIFKFSAIFTDI